MSKVTDKWFPLIPVLLVLIPTLTVHSCANTTQAPTGGQKDSIPPVVVKVVPETRVRRVPLTGARFTFTFDEYVTIKDPKGIVLSPPTRKGAKAKTRGKSVTVSFEDTLQANTTYTIDFTDAIADNNEGNKFPGYTYVFSTGDEIDEMMITGIVQDCNTLQAVKGATVMLYKDLSDSAVFKSPAFAVAKTDDWGFFCIRNIPDTLYHLYAVKDENSNNLYDPGVEDIGFIAGEIRPATVVNDSLPEVIKYEMTDTLACRARHAEYELNLFREKSSIQYISNSGRLSDRASFISFTSPGAHIDTMWIGGVSADRLITQMNIERDSLEIWVNDRRAMPDTFHLYVNYLKTDSTGVLSPFTEQVKLVNPVPARVARRNRRDIKHEDTICVFSIEAKGETVENQGITLQFKYPLVSAAFDSVRMWSVNPRQVEEQVRFSVERDSNNLRFFHIIPDVKYRDGFDYHIKTPQGAFRDINGFASDSAEAKFTLPKDDKLSSITLKVCDLEDAKYIIDLLDENKNNILQQYIIDKDSTLTFKYLRAAKYCIRITEDTNRNSIVDTGDILSGRQPEKVLFFKSSDAEELINILEGIEIEQTIDIAVLFGHKEKADPQDASVLPSSDEIPDKDEQSPQDNTP